MASQGKIHGILTKPESQHGLSLFCPAELDAIERLIIDRKGKYFITCQVKNKLKLAKSEEIVRQLWIYRLITEYGFPKDRVDVERVVTFGVRDSGLTDIVVLHSDLTHPYIIFEVKRPKRSDGLEQLKSYCNAEGAPIGVWSNGNEMIRLHREEPNIFIELPRIPKVTETLKDILTERWTLEWLEKHDELKQGKTTLKKILLDLEELVLGNAGEDPFEEIFKLIYAKLYDEWNAINDTYYQLEFYVGDRSPTQTKDAIRMLLEGAKRIWSGVFEPTDEVELRDDHLKVCVSFLEKIKLFNSNLRIIDDAFEYMIPQVSKKKEGQFFTPRPVEDMAVRMLNPRPSEFVIDPACGSAGFLLHSVMWIAKGAITGKELPTPAKNFAQNNIVGIDFAKKPVRIAKAINLIIGDGKSHIYKDNSLAPKTWSKATKSGLESRLQRFSDNVEEDRNNLRNYLYFDFDVLLTNPPFAGTVKEKNILRLYDLAEKRGKLVNKIGRHILFLNRCLHFLRPGGRMAIVLPQGLLNNTKQEYIRRWVLNEGRILAVVGLHVNTFKPHTGTKTSVLFVKKHTEKEKRNILKIKTKYESNWESFIAERKDNCSSIDWESQVQENDVHDDLMSFIRVYFDVTEDISQETSGDAKNDEDDEQKNGKKPIEILIKEFRELSPQIQKRLQKLNNLDKKIGAILEQRKSLGMKGANREKTKKLQEKISTYREKQKPLKAELKGLEKELTKIYRGISERTLGGQISLILNTETILKEFKEYWINSKVMMELDYPIFFAINQEPVKDNKGEYRYIREPTGEFVLDSHGHPKINHDLDEIAEAFVQFSRKQKFGFWRK